MDLEPLFSRIIVKRKEMEDTTKGGIIIPKTSREMQATEGEVVAVGSEVDTIKEGDSVFYGKYSGAEIEREGTRYIVMNEEDVIAKVKKDSWEI